MLPIDVLTIAERQHSLVTHRQVREHLTQRQLTRRLGRALMPVQPRVYRVAGSPATYEQWVLAAVLAGGPGTFASWRAAAALFELDGFPRQPIEITTPADRRTRLGGVLVHDTRISGIRHVDVIAGIPVSSAARTVCDLTAALPLGRVARVLDESLRRRLTTLEEVRSVYFDLKHRGRRRSTVMRTLLEERLGGLEPGGSAPEVALVRTLVGAGLPAPTQQHEIRIGEMRFLLDLAYPELRIAIEYDGWEFHSTRGAFDADRNRGNLIVTDGWVLLRFTSKSSREEVVETVRRAIESQSRLLRSAG
ncbi:MAG TPA: hypothetical protein VFZ83_03230 [Acidimicrobiia bacterium]|nr:hypothetical protein [Acidimicrobiia bacterium]